MLHSTRIALYGACDRYNYGDLLFPPVTRHFLRQGHPDWEFLTVGLLESNLSAYGADPTVPSGVLRDELLCSAVVVCGGEILRQLWPDMLSMLISREQGAALWNLRTAFGLETASVFSRMHLGAVPSLPGIFLCGDLPQPVATAYNSVGGWPLERASAEELEMIGRGLREASHVSVRDTRTAELLSERCGIEAGYAPDAVVLLSRLYPPDSLRRRATPALVEQLDRDGPYWCFQVNPWVGESMVPELARSIDRVGQETGLATVFVPIGRCTGWEDRTVLDSLREVMSGPSVILDSSTTIFDIA